MMAKGVLQTQDFDWQGTVKPYTPREKTIIYEAHVKGMTALHPEVPEQLRGTYLGMAHPAVIRHLLELGITTVQLLPVAAFMSEPRLEKLKLSNYWGYNPVSFFAPEPRYQYQDAVTEFKTLVRSYHQAGIEVILDVVFNHTAEAGCGVAMAERERARSGIGRARRGVCGGGAQGGEGLNTAGAGVALPFAAAGLGGRRQQQQ